MPTLSLATDSISAKIVCEEIQKRKSNELQLSESTSPGNFEIIQRLLNPSTSIGVIPFEQVQTTPTVTDSSSPTNITFTVFSPDKSTYLTDDEKFNFEYRKYWLKTQISRYISPLESTSSIEDCTMKASRIGLTDAIATEIEAQVNNYIALRAKMVAKSTSQIIEGASSDRFNLKIMSTKSYMDLIPQLKSLEQVSPGQKLNLVLVLHGSTEGVASDLAGYTIPPLLFSQLSTLSNIGSISILACYPSKLADFYKTALQKISENGVPIYFAQSEGPLNSLQQVDVKLFQYFLEKVSQIIK